MERGDPPSDDDGVAATLVLGGEDDAPLGGHDPSTLAAAARARNRPSAWRRRSARRTRDPAPRPPGIRAPTRSCAQGSRELVMRPDSLVAHSPWHRIPNKGRSRPPSRGEQRVERSRAWPRPPWPRPRKASPRQRIARRDRVAARWSVRAAYRPSKANAAPASTPVHRQGRHPGRGQCHASPPWPSLAPRPSATRRHVREGEVKTRGHHQRTLAARSDGPGRRGRAAPAGQPPGRQTLTDTRPLLASRPRSPGIRR
jgi:hypothetical protein